MAFLGRSWIHLDGPRILEKSGMASWLDDLQGGWAGNCGMSRLFQELGKNMKNGETHENHIVNSWSTCSCSKLSKFLPSFGGDFLPRFRWRKEDRNWQSQRREDTLQGGNPKGLELMFEKMTTWNQWSPPNAILSAFYLAFYLEYILT